ncbi:hypothetical protein, partial [Thiolapillus sp.]|uniref:hypothetical protein n=1 Tax=Thiolapillus sp. TaxID=2017437 RepID=UPI003AF78B1B
MRPWSLPGTNRLRFALHGGQRLREDLRIALWPDKHIRMHNYSIRHDTLGCLLWRQFLRNELFDPNDEVNTGEILVEQSVPTRSSVARKVTVHQHRDEEAVCDEIRA